MIRLGLIGDNIKASRAPKLHRLCGRMCGVEVSYELLIPSEQGLGFDALFERCRASGYRGLNITLPYKVCVMPKLQVNDPLVRRIGAVNTVVFEAGGAFGFNTDYTGFIAAWRNSFGARSPGRVAIAGAGGAGKAVAFSLLALGAEEVRVFDFSRAMADKLAADLSASGKERFKASAADSIEDAVKECDGIVNCTPLGMDGYGGTAVPAHLCRGKSWVFDAVYTPMQTVFLADAKAAGLDILGGYELHFYQGIRAFEHFAGQCPGDLEALRRRHLDNVDA
jgi:shikimate dehydrogenase